MQEQRAEAFRSAYLWQSRVVTGPVLFDVGHELVRAVVEATETSMGLEDALAGVLRLASEAALQQGAALGENGLAVKLVSPLPESVGPGDLDLPPDREIIGHVANRLREGDLQRYVVDVRVVRRMFAGEHLQARVELWTVPYQKVFTAGDVIYSARIDGADSRTEVFNQLWNLVTKLVRREAQEEGLLPHPRTGEYGALPAAELLEALDALTAAGQPMLVEAIADRDTYTSDPLVVRLEVTDVGDDDRS